MKTAFLVVALICRLGAEDCVSESRIFRETTALAPAKWCDQFAWSRAHRLANGYAPGTRAAVRDVYCEVLE